ncbi:MAG: hemerythrin domain-containing protein [Deltaproteobacteria bacterium]|nr:hemerythrin domain-containing protein [Deltaproteobacteria bacterium]
MLLQIAVRVPDEKDPLGLLATSLRRHLSKLRALWFAAGHLRDPDVETRSRALRGLAEALEFFARAADDPFREEDELLFPRLLQASPGDQELALACRSLSRDRVLAEALHARAALGARAAVAGSYDGAHAEFADAVASLDALYRGHLERLEGQIFPRARTLLDPSTCEALAGDMLDDAVFSMLPEQGMEPSPVQGLP